MSGLANVKKRIEKLEKGQRKEALKAALKYAEGLKTGKVTVKTTRRDVGRLVEMFLLLADEFPRGDGQENRGPELTREQHIEIAKAILRIYGEEGSFGRDAL